MITRSALFVAISLASFVGFLPVAYAQLNPSTVVGTAAGTIISNLLTKNGQSAVTAAGLTGNTKADAMCTPFVQECGCHMQKDQWGHCAPSGNTYNCTCGQSENGITVSGICDATLHCLAKTVGGMNGGAASSPTSLSQLGQSVAQILQSLMQGGGGSGGSGSGSGTSGTQGCTAYYPVSSPSTDPCAYYVPATSTGTSTADTSSQDLLDALNGVNTSGDASQFQTGNGGNASGNTTGNPTTGLNSDLSITGTYNPLNPQSAGTSSQGLTGIIQQSGTGATFISSNVQGNSGSASFFGGDTFNGAVSGLVGGWCRTRPWATGFFASIITPTFFDGLCKQGGFAVGSPAPASVPSDSISLTQTAIQNIKQPAPPVITTSTPSIPGRVDIWAVPTSVSLGARTTIFWNTSNVSNCTETSPDGSFNQTTLSGGAATVPLTETTIYTISCLDLGKNPVTGYATVTIGG